MIFRSPASDMETGPMTPVTAHTGPGTILPAPGPRDGHRLFAPDVTHLRAPTRHRPPHPGTVDFIAGKETDVGPPITARFGDHGRPRGFGRRGEVSDTGTVAATMIDRLVHHAGVDFPEGTAPR
jgi:hypothetical protein